MKVRRQYIVFLSSGMSAALLLLFLAVPRHFFAAPLEQQAQWCECVHYVLNRFGLSMAGGPYFIGAADMGPFLESRGFARVAEPAAGTIIVFPRSFGSGINTTYGHVGVVTEVHASGGAWHMVVRGARQSWPEWSEHGCSNVSDMQGISVPYGSSSATFYTANTAQASVAVAAPAPGRLQLVDSLALSSVSIQESDLVHASFAVQIVGGQALLLEELTVGGRQGSNWDAVIVADFPYVRQITLEPGEVYRYAAGRIFDHAGRYFAQPVAKVNGSWGAIEGEDRVEFTVHAPHASATSQDSMPFVVPTPSVPSRIQAQWTENDDLAEGTYTFRVQGGQGIRVYLDGQLVLDGLQPHESYVAAQTVSGGQHEVTIVVYQDNDGSHVHYDWEAQT
jgi:hypothetical protein